MTHHPDLFTNVHKGIRRALFDTCISLGNAPDGVVPASLRTQLRAVLHFVHHHGENEDILLLPMLAETAPAVQRRMQQAHAEIEASLRAIEHELDHADAGALYQRLCEFTARYLDHMREEELQLEPQIRAVLSAEQIQEIGRGSVARTAPEDARTMLSWMLPAMRTTEASELLARLPQALQSELRALIKPEP